VPRRLFTVDLLHLAEPFERWCAPLGTTKAAFVRELVATAIGQPPAQVKARPCAAPVPVARKQAVVLPRNGSSFRLQDVERAALFRQAAAAGLSASRYVGALLLAAEGGGPSIAGKDAVQALTESNHHLAWIVRKLSQAARRQEGAPEQGAQIGGEGIGEAMGPVREHLARAAAVLAEVERTRTGRRVGLPRARDAREAKGDEAIAR